MKPIVGAMYDNEDQQASVQQDYSNWLTRGGVLSGVFGCTLTHLVLIVGIDQNFFNLQGYSLGI